MPEDERKPQHFSGRDPPPAFAALLGEHLRRGTRPGRDAGRPWQRAEFARAVGTSDRALRFWLEGNLPTEQNLISIERVLFGTDPAAHAEERDALRATYRHARAVGETVPELAGPKELEPPVRCFGREAPVEQLVTALTGDRPAACLVLGGPGIGKTTLTREAATSAAVAARFGARRWLVELETAGDAAALQTAIVAAVGLNPATAKFDRALARLAERPSLLILDNLETPWAAEGQALPVETALRRIAAQPGVVLLASIRGDEAPFAPHWTHQISVEPLGDVAARRLFSAIARRIKPDDPDLADFLAALGGVPLAIELVAYRAQTHVTLAELWREWQRLGTVLATRHGVERSRLTSLPHSIELSLQSRRLAANGRRLFSLLGQLPAGIAARDRAILLGDAALSAAEELRGIGLAVERGDGRIDLLPPVRDHAHRHHPPEGEGAERWREHYFSLLCDPGAKIGTSDGIGAVARLMPEFPNLEEALRATLDANTATETIGALTGLTRLMSFTGLGSPSLLNDLSATYRTAGDTYGEADCIQSLGDVALRRSDHDAARQAFEQALPLYRKIGHILGEANSVRGLGDIALRHSEHEAAREAYERALPLFRRVGAALGEANCIQRLGDIAMRRSNQEAAREAYERALPLYRQIGDILGEANCIRNLGDIAFRRSDYQTARKAYERALRLHGQIGDLLGEANDIQSLGDIALSHSDHTIARQAYERALPLYQQTGDLLGEANCLQRLGDIALRRSELAAAHQAYERALPLYRHHGSILGEANCIQRLGDIALRGSDHSAAREAYERALPLYRQIGDILGEANCIVSCGEIAFSCSDHDAAREAYERALPLCQRIGAALTEANCECRFGDIARRTGDEMKAGEHYRRALELYSQVSENEGVGWVHLRLARRALEPDHSLHLTAARAAWEQSGLLRLTDRLNDPDSIDDREW